MIVSSQTASQTSPAPAQLSRVARPDASRYFQFDLPPLDAGAHVAEVYAVRESGGARRVLQLIGKPVRFVVGASDKNMAVVR